MEKSLSQKIARHLKDKARVGSHDLYSIEIVNDGGSPLSSFHQFADNKAISGAFKVTNNDNGVMHYLLLIDWWRKRNYYLVISPENLCL